MIPTIERTMTTGTEVETVPRETSALLLTPPEGTPTSPADADILADARAAGPQLVAQHQAGLRRRLEGLHQLVFREPVRRPAGNPCRRRPLPGAPGGNGEQDDGHRAHALGCDRRGPPPGRTRGPDHAAAGEGPHETAGQGIRETQEAGQGADQRGSGRGYAHVYGVHSGGVYPRAEQHEHGPGKGRNKLAILELFRNTPESTRELPANAGELDNPVSPPWRGLVVRLTRRPGQRGQHHAPTGSFLGCLDKEFFERNIDVDIVEFEVEGGPHVGRAYDARCRVVLPSHPPQFLAFGEGHPQPAVAARDGAFGRDFSGHSPNFTTTARGGGGHARRVFSVNFYLDCGVGKSLHPGRPRHRLAHRKGPLKAEIAVRTTGLLTAGRNPGLKGLRGKYN